MRLIAVTLQNYRIHREFSIRLSPTITLIGGPNESGKSTLVEAIHRALFMKAKGNTEQHREMVSEGMDATPEVRLEFEAEGSLWQLTKRFGPGPKGYVTLSTANAPILASEDAEAKLSQLIRNPTSQSGSEMLAQWEHLWVWQGSSGRDPREPSQRQHDALIRRLQAVGGSGIVQSEVDGWVVSTITDRVSKSFLQNNKPKAGSDLASAEKTFEECELNASQAASRWADYGNKSDRLNEIREQIRLGEQEQQSTRALLEGIKEKLRRVERTRNCIKDEDRELEKHQDKWKGLNNGLSQILQFEASLADTLEKLTPLRAQIDNLRGQVVDVRNQQTTLESKWNTTRESVRKARLLLEWLKARANRIEAESDCGRSQRELDSLEDRRSKLTAARSHLETRRSLDKKGLNRLISLEADLRATVATVEAMAAEVEIIVSDQPVSIDGKPVAAGAKTLLTHDGLIQIGTAIRIRVKPGGGTSLEEARAERDEAQERLRRELDSHGLPDIAAAQSVHDEWTLANNDLKEAEQALNALDVDDIEQSFSRSQARLFKAQAEVNRLELLVDHDNQSSTCPDETSIGILIQEAQAAFDSAEKEEKSAEENLTVARALLKQKEESLEESTIKTRKLEDSSVSFTSQLENLLKKYGEKTTLHIQLKQVNLEIDAAQIRRAKMQADLDELSPESLLLHKERREKALDVLDNQLQDDRNEVIRIQTLLQANGQDDPRAALDMATARLRSATTHLESLRLQGEALLRLRTLFESAQKALADRLAHPFQEKVSHYMGLVFGVSAKVQLDLGASGFDRISLFRNDGGPTCFEFDHLSGGTREQLAVAVRLAMAEVLAEEYGGCLPVILDDAFAYSDPERVIHLQDMLYLAAKRGLQIILLSCTPKDYLGMGGTEIILRQPKAAVHDTKSFEGRVPKSENHEVIETIKSDDEADAMEAITMTVPTNESVSQEYCDAFLSHLPVKGESIGNTLLRRDLGWGEEQYEAVRENLYRTGLIDKGRGRGGSVRRVL